MGIKASRSVQFEWPLALLRQQIASSDLLPPRYAKYRPLLADGICFFLEHISPARLKSIFLEQSRLPLSAPLAQRLVTLLHHLPTLHKVGQVLARDRRLDRGFRAHLQQLESFEPRTPVSDIVQILDGELTGWRKAGIELGPQPLAEGSVAVVMPFEWHEAPRGQSSSGVFKVLKAGVNNRLSEDLAIWSHLGEFLDEQCERYHLPHLEYQETFETVRDLLVNEIHLESEQQHLAEAAHLYAAMDSVVIPALLPFCSRHVTAMERIAGEPLTHRLSRHGPSLQAFAPVIAQALMSHPVFSARPAALFHGDPHAGNLLVTPDNRLGILDWSLVGRLQKPDRVELFQLLVGALAQDRSRMEQALDKLFQSKPERKTMIEILNQSLRELRWGVQLGMNWLIRLLDGMVMRTGAHFPSDFLIFRKSLLTLEGVLADVTGQDERSGAAVLDSALVSTFFAHFLAEWPQRFQQPLQSRSFATHLSTSDLLALSSPTTVARYWLGAWLDFARAVRP